jgi:hypothetical protein
MPEFWTEVVQTVCPHCQAPIGENAWVYGWNASGWVHIHCWEEHIQEEKKIEGDAWLSEVSAQRLKLSIEAFRALPSWVRGRENRKSQAGTVA